MNLHIFLNFVKESLQPCVGNTIYDKGPITNPTTKKLSYAEVTRRTDESQKEQSKIQKNKTNNSMRQQSH
jgi:hypothetical protein